MVEASAIGLVVDVEGPAESTENALEVKMGVYKQRRRFGEVRFSLLEFSAWSFAR